jgi:flagellar protein FlgJ
VSSSTVGPTYYADFNGLEGIKKGAKADDPKAIRAAAQQFESLFTDMMLKSMREANLGAGLGDSQESDLYQGMYDQQIAVQMSQGKGIGLADMLVQQLTRNAAAKAPSTAQATVPAVGTGAGAAATVSQASQLGFVQQLEPYAQRAAAQLGVSADTIIAQAALETGWGQHVPGAATGATSNNLFGIKAGSGWNGAAVSAPTTEFSQGSASSVAQPFRAYSSVEQGVNDYVTLLQRSARYQQALGTGSDVSAFATGLTQGGYATDPDYVQKLQATVASVKVLRAASNVTALKLLGGVPTPTGGEAA